jgi:hypothetical protein
MFGRMAVLPRPSSPRALLADLKTFLATRQRHQLLIAAVSIAMPVLIVAGFYHDSHVEPPPKEMYFLPSWPADRSDAEIIAQQKIDQKIKEQKDAEKRAGYRRLADKLGIEYQR